MLVNGTVTTQNGTIVGSKATYDCNSNYRFTLNSSMERICQSSRKWSEETIECAEEEKRSDNIIIIIHDVVSDNYKGCICTC